MIKDKILVIGLNEPFKSLSDEIEFELLNNVDEIKTLDDIKVIYIGIDNRDSLDDVKAAIINIRRRCGYRNIPIVAVGNENTTFILNQTVSFGASSFLTLPKSREKLLENIKKHSLPIGKRIPLDVAMINPFISGTQQVFETMSGITVKRRSLFLKNDYKIFGEVAGIMELNGDASGSVAINFSHDLAKKIISIVLDIDIEELEDEDVEDGIGEILNMIAGQAKALLAGTKYHFTLSIPVVVIGYGYQMKYPKDAPCIVIIFDALDSQFAIQISLLPSKIR